MRSMVILPRGASAPATRVSEHTAAAENSKNLFRFMSLFSFGDTQNRHLLSQSSRYQRNHSHRASRSADDLKRRGDHDRAGQWQTVEVDEACQSELSMTVHHEVIAERRVERGRLSCVGSYCFYADTEDLALLRKKQ